VVGAGGMVRAKAEIAPAPDRLLDRYKLISRLLGEPYSNARRPMGWATAVKHVGLHARWDEPSCANLSARL
jgi:hypothetical protein